MKIKINGKNLEHFTDISLKRSLDSIASTFSISVRFNPENDDHKELFKPLQYFDIQIYSDSGELLFTGTILNHAFKSDSGFNLLVISGYSKCGILEDITVPPSMYPLESNKRSLREIANKLCNAFGVKILFDSTILNEVDRVFSKSTCDATETVKSYITKLTSQRNILLSHNEKGEIVLFKPNLKAKPKYYFNKDNTLSMSSTWNGQAMHSQINVVRQPSAENAGVSTIDKVDSFYVKKYRPTTKVLSSGEDTDTKKAAENEYAAELKNISLSIELEGLFNDIKPGDLINVHNHEIYSFAYSRWIVSDIDFSINQNENKTNINLQLPESFSGEVEQNSLFFYESHKRND